MQLEWNLGVTKKRLQQLYTMGVGGGGTRTTESLNSNKTKGRLAEQRTSEKRRLGQPRDSKRSDI